MVEHLMTSKLNGSGRYIIRSFYGLSGWRATSVRLWYGIGLLCLLSNQQQALCAIPLPELGSPVAAACVIEQERLLGDLTIRQIRGQQLLLTDPLLNHYLTTVGQRLLLHAESLQHPLQFYWLNNNAINAFALFGGHVVLHTSLLQATDCESELAAVLAHEIAHVTQRHLARLVEAQQRTKPIAWAAALGSAMLMLANPTAGLAALTSTVGGLQQHSLAYTQAHEQEADRIGMALLMCAGFDPRAMASFLEKLAALADHSTQIPEILLTHPLPKRRLADSRDRLPQRSSSQIVTTSLEYALAKIRWQHLYSLKLTSCLNGLQSTSITPEIDAQWQPLLQGYNQALEHYCQGQFEQGSKRLQPLLVRYPEQIWLIDLMSDLDLAQRRYGVAIQRLQQALNSYPNHPVLLLNLANAYLKQGSSSAAVILLQPYCHTNPHSSLGWRLLSQAYAARGLLAEEQAAQAEWLALQGAFEPAQQALQRACRLAGEQSLKTLRYQARMAQLQRLQRTLLNAKKF
jgi:predicted Zn-dependent protease